MDVCESTDKLMNTYDRLKKKLVEEILTKINFRTAREILTTINNRNRLNYTTDIQQTITTTIATDY